MQYCKFVQDTELMHSSKSSIDVQKAIAWMRANVPHGSTGAEAVSWLKRPANAQKVLTALYGIQAANEIIRSGNVNSVLSPVYNYLMQGVKLN